MISYTEYDSPLGRLLLAASARGISGLYFEEHKYFSGPGDWRRDGAHPHLAEAVRQLEEYFRGERLSFNLPLDASGTPFQQAVWDALRSLRFGTTTTYAAIAERIARPNAIRATGTAIGRNPISIIVPCHRVLGASGGLSGFAGGLPRKRYLLDLESRLMRE
ncbi:methylated-DNA--[protein]-cysteine S-methyltransferase [Noviherbaspirillum aerium]|uniref:methylated-DNA--[protein]-cysteine S-methyltransferase n=1 Tax=Noviherbaspirillum aerium TaxID=2588497 RepID=UPI00124E4A25|nr:methylated-DNA--[protein]-cysteine S-methyltransferase [Noviherbaspirillum aerium]